MTNGEALKMVKNFKQLVPNRRDGHEAPKWNLDLCMPYTLGSAARPLDWWYIKVFYRVLLPAC